MRRSGLHSGHSGRTRRVLGKAVSVGLFTSSVVVGMVVVAPVTGAANGIDRSPHSVPAPAVEDSGVDRARD